MDENSQWYYTDSSGQQAGPVSLTQLRTMIQQSMITGQSMAWSEGMDDWKPISKIDGLISTPGTHIPQPNALQQSASTQTTPAAAGNPYAPPQTQVTAEPTEDDYPIPEVKRTNYGLMVTALVIGFVLLMAGVFQMGFESNTSSNQNMFGDDYGTTSNAPDDISPAAVIMMIVGIVVLLFGGILSLIYLHRAWTLLQPGGASTTPGKAVGFLFIPFFNLYWYFVAYWKWSQDWNRIVSTHRKLAAAPRATEGLFLAYAILNIVGVLVSLAGFAGLIVFLMIMKQVCNSVNYMHDLRVSQPHRQTGGIGL